MTRTTIIKAKLTDKAVVAAEGYTVRDQLPVIALCRLLVAEGYDPATPMHVYRGDTLALIVRSIGEAARLCLSSKGSGFVVDKTGLRGAYKPAGRFYA